MKLYPIGEPVPLKGGGYIKRALPLFKWRRKDGIATFVRDLIDCRKPILLCPSCEGKMPRRWTEKYDYALVMGFRENSACDYCRLEQGPANMYQTVHGKYHADLLEMQRSVRETRERERQLFLKDRKYLIGY